VYADAVLSRPAIFYRLRQRSMGCCSTKLAVDAPVLVQDVGVSIASPEQHLAATRLQAAARGLFQRRLNQIEFVSLHATLPDEHLKLGITLDGFKQWLSMSRFPYDVPGMNSSLARATKSSLAEWGT
jgi:hypothetical protein